MIIENRQRATGAMPQAVNRADNPYLREIVAAFAHDLHDLARERT